MKASGPPESKNGSPGRYPFLSGEDETNRIIVRQFFEQLGYVEHYLKDLNSRRVITRIGTKRWEGWATPGRQRHFWPCSKLRIGS